MIFQIDFLGSIIGSAIATGFSIGVWVIINKIETLLKKKKENQNINKLYRLFLKPKLEPFMASEIAVEINDIGEIRILKVLKLVVSQIGSGFYLKNERYDVIISYKIGANTIRIMEAGKTYNYEVPGTNKPIKESFLKFFEQQCKSKKIKLKK